MKKKLLLSFLSLALVIMMSSSLSFANQGLTITYNEEETSEYLYPTFYIENTSNKVINVDYSVSDGLTGDVDVEPNSTYILKLKELKYLANTGKEVNVLFSWMVRGRMKPVQDQFYITPFYGDIETAPDELPVK